MLPQSSSFTNNLLFNNKFYVIFNKSYVNWGAIMLHKTGFLKLEVLLIGTLFLAFFIFLLPSLTKEAAEQYSKLAFLQYPFLIGFFALYQALKLLSYFDKNNAFFELPVKALKTI